jgi:hypothetical protein
MFSGVDGWVETVTSPADVSSGPDFTTLALADLTTAHERAHQKARP